MWQGCDFAWTEDHPFQPREVEFTIRSFHGFLLSFSALALASNSLAHGFAVFDCSFEAESGTNQ
jgi:hypothetical protein